MVQISTLNTVAFKGIQGERLMDNVGPQAYMMFAHDSVQKDTLDMLEEGVDEFIYRSDRDQGDIMAARHTKNLMTVLVKTNPANWVVDRLHQVKAKLTKFIDG